MTEDGRVGDDPIDEGGPPAEAPPGEAPPGEAPPGEAPPGEGPPPRRSTAREVGAVLALGWPRAIARSVVAFLVVLLLAAALVVLDEAADPSGRSFFDVLRAIGLVFYFFHHTGIEPDFTRLGLTEAAGSPFAEFSFTFAVALLLGTLLALWLLYRGGRAVARSVGGATWARSLHGAKVAIPYALLAFAMSFVAEFSEDVPQSEFLPTSGPLVFMPSPISALLWPLALGLVAGTLGGLASGEQWAAPEGFGARVRAVLRGGLAMTLYATGLAFVGYLVVVALHPDLPLPFSPRFFQEVGSEGLGGVNLLLLTILVIPNIAIWVLVPALGGSVGFDLAGFSYQFLSYTRFPTGVIGQVTDPAAPIPGLPQLDTAPAPYFLLLLVPLVATVLGGWWAARRAPTRSGADGAATGALAGVIFAIAVGALIVLASIALRFRGDLAGVVQTGSGHVGPPFLLGTLLALVWGVAGGAVGGLLGGRRAAPAAPGEAMGFEGVPPAPPGDTEALPPAAPVPPPEAPPQEEPGEEDRRKDEPGEPAGPP
jgi:hypothetical protein